MLSDNLRKHYVDHGVLDIEQFLQHGSSTTASGNPQNEQLKTSFTSIQHDGNNEQKQPGINDTFRFIRLNPRFHEVETLRLLTVSKRCTFKTCSEKVKFLP